MSKERRITVSLDKLTAEDVDWLTDDTGLSQTELVGQGLRLLRLYRETVRDGGEMLRSTKDSKELSIIIFL